MGHQSLMLSILFGASSHIGGAVLAVVLAFIASGRERQVVIRVDA